MNQIKTKLYSLSCQHITGVTPCIGAEFSFLHPQKKITQLLPNRFDTGSYIVLQSDTKWVIMIQAKTAGNKHFAYYAYFVKVFSNPFPSATTCSHKFQIDPNKGRNTRIFNAFGSEAF